VCHQTPTLRSVVSGLFLATFLMGVPLDASEDLEIVYLANEGFLLRAGDTVVLVDALFGEGIRGYSVVPADVRAELENGAPPYDGVDLVLASHHHRDHFNARSVATLMATNSTTSFVSSEQAASDLLDLAPELAQRVHGIYPREGTFEARSSNGVAVRIFNLHHGRGRPLVQNLGLLIEICGTTVLHVGDTEADAADLRSAGLQDLKPDVALMPSWHLRTDGQIEGIRQVIKPRQIVAMHLPTRDAPPNYFWGALRSHQALVKAIQSELPGTFVPLATGDGITLPCPVD
jgi:L-ascorbate metabolism protein UlaG (beta-lactamase superfamily)